MPSCERETEKFDIILLKMSRRNYQPEPDTRHEKVRYGFQEKQGRLKSREGAREGFQEGGHWEKIVAHQQSDLVLYKKRAESIIGGTPSVKILQKTGNIMTVGVHNPQSLLFDWLDGQDPECRLAAVEKALQTFSQLAWIYGHFYVDRQMMKVTAEGEPVSWIHSNFVMNLREFPIKPSPVSQSIFVRKLRTTLSEVIQFPPTRDTETLSSLKHLLREIKYYKFGLVPLIRTTIPAHLHKPKPQPNSASQFKQDPHQTDQFKQDPHQTDQFKQDPHQTDQFKQDTHQTDQFKQDPHQTNQFKKEFNRPFQSRQESSKVHQPRQGSVSPQGNANRMRSRNQDQLLPSMGFASPHAFSKVPTVNKHLKSDQDRLSGAKEQVGGEAVGKNNSQPMPQSPCSHHWGSSNNPERRKYLEKNQFEGKAGQGETNKVISLEKVKNRKLSADQVLLHDWVSSSRKGLDQDFAGNSFSTRVTISSKASKGQNQVPALEAEDPKPRKLDKLWFSVEGKDSFGNRHRLSGNMKELLRQSSMKISRISEEGEMETELENLFGSETPNSEADPLKESMLKKELENLFKSGRLEVQSNEEELMTELFDILN